MSINDNIFDLLDEMAKPTGPILAWKAQVHIKQYLDSGKSAPEIGKAIAKKLCKCNLFMDEDESEYVIYNLERVRSSEELNEWLGVMYDVCDSARVWCGARGDQS
jgi:hypothetical protein